MKKLDFYLYLLKYIINSKLYKTDHKNYLLKFIYSKVKNVITKPKNKSCIYLMTTKNNLKINNLR